MISVLDQILKVSLSLVENIIKINTEKQKNKKNKALLEYTV